MNSTVGSFDPRIKKRYSVKVYIMAVHSLIRIESLSPACKKCLEFADFRFNFLVPWSDCKRAATIPKLELSDSVKGLV